ncbi:hypothetical protein [Actinomyces sp.]|uniref:hypothetical protein n=1 Tax=Actinomyces sp. TaxID=29317 RepID=UPI0026DAA594|nr:hypothetical protein [Actinomyces sp.]MDO4655672.1 hypothetical protein [Actinomyces sp.]
MSDTIVASIIGAAGAIIAALASTVMSARNKKGSDGDRIYVAGNGNAATIEKHDNRTYNTYNMHPSRVTSSNDDAFVLVVSAVAILACALVGLGVFGGLILVGVATMGSVFVLFLLIFSLIKDISVKKIYLLGYFLFGVLLWVSVHCVTTSNVFLVLQNAVRSGGFTQRASAAFSVGSAGHAVPIVFLLVVFSVFIAIWSGVAILIKCSNVGYGTKKGGGKEFISCFIATAMLVISCFGDLIGSWIGWLGQISIGS